MGFKDVFASLQDTFPQVDFRLLRAVAIEHANDVDAAAEFVITEVLSLGEVSKDDAQVSSGMKQLSLAGSSGVKVEVDTVPSEAKDPPAAGSSKEAIYIETDGDEDENDDHLSRPKLGSSKEIIYIETDDDEEENDDHLSRPKCMMHDNSLVRSDDGSALSDPVVLVCYTNEPNSITKIPSLELPNAVIKSDPDHYTEQVDTNCIIDNVILHHKLHTQSADTSVTNVDNNTSLSNVDVMDGFAMNSASGIQTTQPFNIMIVEGNVQTFNNGAGLFQSVSEGGLDKVKIRYVEESGELPQCLFQPAICHDIVMTETNEPSIGVDCALGENALRFSGNDTPDFSRGSDDIGNLTSNMVDVCDEQHSSFLNGSSADLLHLEAAMLSSHEDCQNATTAAQSSLFAGVEFLDSFVSDAKRGKENLVSSMESVIKMMADVTIIEEKAEQATKEASDAGQEILNKVEELKKTLKHAKEQNNMTAGEVYGEKAILSDEARELQSRLLNLSDERNKALTAVEQIREALELRIVAAKLQIAASEKERLEKEALAQAALEEQELTMDSIVQESKRLQQEAEENSKLREFLMDRGRLVDTLQGEIAVICEDVLALKERVESGRPLEKLSQSTASSLASSLSLSSVRSKSSIDVAVQSADINNFPRAGAEESQKVTQPDDNAQPEDKICLDDQKESADDDEWEMFEMI